MSVTGVPRFSPDSPIQGEFITKRPFGGVFGYWSLSAWEAFFQGTIIIGHWTLVRDWNRSLLCWSEFWFWADRTASKSLPYSLRALCSTTTTTSSLTRHEGNTYMSSLLFYYNHCYRRQKIKRKKKQQRKIEQSFLKKKNKNVKKLYNALTQQGAAERLIRDVAEGTHYHFSAATNQTREVQWVTKNSTTSIKLSMMDGRR